MTFFGKIKHFEKLSTGKDTGNDGDSIQEMTTEHFFEACRQVITMFDMFGVAFNPVKSDMNGNLDALTKKFKSNPLKYLTLSQLLPADEYKGKSAGESALWLKRALEFISTFLFEIIQDYRNTSSQVDSVVPMATVAYEKTLKPYHGWVVQKIFSLITKAAPYKKAFLKNLAYGGEGMDEQVINDIVPYQETLAANTETLDQLINSLIAKDVYIIHREKMQLIILALRCIIRVFVTTQVINDIVPYQETLAANTETLDQLIKHLGFDSQKKV